MEPATVTRAARSESIPRMPWSKTRAADPSPEKIMGHRVSLMTTAIDATAARPKSIPRMSWLRTRVAAAMSLRAMYSQALAMLILLCVTEVFAAQSPTENVKDFEDLFDVGGSAKDPNVYENILNQIEQVPEIKNLYAQFFPNLFNEDKLAEIPKLFGLDDDQVKVFIPNWQKVRQKMESSQSKANVIRLLKDFKPESFTPFTHGHGFKKDCDRARQSSIWDEGCVTMSDGAYGWGAYYSFGPCRKTVRSYGSDRHPWGDLTKRIRHVSRDRHFIRLTFGVADSELCQSICGKTKWGLVSARECRKTAEPEADFIRGDAIALLTFQCTRDAFDKLWPEKKCDDNCDACKCGICEGDGTVTTYNSYGQKEPPSQCENCSGLGSLGTVDGSKCGKCKGEKGFTKSVFYTAFGFPVGQQVVPHHTNSEDPASGQSMGPRMEMDNFLMLDPQYMARLIQDTTILRR